MKVLTETSFMGSVPYLSATMCLVEGISFFQPRCSITLVSQERGVHQLYKVNDINCFDKIVESKKYVCRSKSNWDSNLQMLLALKLYNLYTEEWKPKKQNC